MNFLRKKADFRAIFRHGQEPGPTPSPWSIISIIKQVTPNYLSRKILKESLNHHNRESFMKRRTNMPYPYLIPEVYATVSLLFLKKCLLSTQLWLHINILQIICSSTEKWIQNKASPCLRAPLDTSPRFMEKNKKNNKNLKM